MGKADLHLHSTVSDGMASVASLLDHVERYSDLDVIAVTDHEDAVGGHRARELAAKRGSRLDVIVGAEVTTRQGHLLALFIEHAPPSFRSIEATLEAIHAQGGLAVVPHPMSWLTRSLSARTIERVVSRDEPGITFDGLELVNPSLAGRVTAARASARNSVWGLATTGSSDAHHLLHAATAWTEFEGATAADFRRALEEHSTVARGTAYPSIRRVGAGKIALGLAWGYTATPRKVLGRRRATRSALS